MEGSALKLYSVFLPQARHWVEELDYYSKSQFRRVPEGCKMSIGQVYDSLIQVSYHFFMKNALDCAYSRNTGQGGKTLKGWLYFKFPLLAFSKSNQGYEYVPISPDSAVVVKDEMYKFLKMIYKVAQEIDNKKSTEKLLHPVFGYLTAEEWLSLTIDFFTDMKKEKKKIDKSVRSRYVVDQLEVEESYYQ